MQINNSRSGQPYRIGIGSWEKRHLRIGLEKKLSSISPFSDMPVAEVEGPHYLFAGCSITAGESLNKEDSWSWKLYEILQDEKGYSKNTFFNVACSGMSVTESINQIFKYCHQFGNPDVVFLFLPDPFRDSKYCGENDDDSDALKTLIYNSYFYLEMFCKNSGISLISSTWYKNLVKIGEEFLPSKEDKYYPDRRELRADWADQLNVNEVNMLDYILSDFETFKKYDEELLTSEVSRYHLVKSKDDKATSLVASDDVHPGTSFHDFWKDFFYDRYKEDLNV